MIAQRCKGIWNLACLSWLSYSSCSQKAVRHFLTVWKLFFFSFLFPSLMFHQRGMNFNSLLCILSLTSMCESPLWHMPAVFLFFFLEKLATNYYYQTSDGRLFISHFLPDHEAVFLGCTAARPSQGRAFNCFLAGGSSWQCLTSFLLWIKKKKKKKRGEKS